MCNMSAAKWNEEDAGEGGGQPRGFLVHLNSCTEKEGEIGMSRAKAKKGRFAETRDLGEKMVETAGKGRATFEP